MSRAMREEAGIMIIYIGDMVNFSFSVVSFMVILWITCEGSRWKRFTLGLLFISTVFAFNGFYDNCVGYALYYSRLDSFFTNMYLPGRLCFAALLSAMSSFERQQKLERENMLALQNRRYYEAMEQQQFEIRRLPPTTKRNVKNHGFGLRSIRETVEKYGGSMEIDRTDGYFYLFLYLPMERR